MTEVQRLQNLAVPCGPVDAVLDTDAFNEVDDQFAISLFLREPGRIRPVALYAAPFYVVAIGAITNVASALLLCPEIKDNIVVVWLGGHSLDWADTREFNMAQDIAAARVVMGCGAPFVQLPCMGVVDAFAISRPELETWLLGHNPLSDYLARTVLQAQGEEERVWTRVIWDVTAVAWLLNDGERFMQSRLLPTPLPAYDGQYERVPQAPLCRYVYHIERDALMQELITRLREA